MTGQPESFSPLLSEASFADIVRELGARFDDIVVICVKDHDLDTYDLQRWYTGDVLRCQGLCTQMTAYIERRQTEKEKEVDENGRAAS